MSRPVLAPLLLPGNPSGVLEAVPKQYADGYLVGKLLAAPTATEDGKVPVWNNGTGQWAYTTPSGGGGSLTLAEDYATASDNYIPFTSTLSGSISSAKTGGIYFNPLWHILKTNLFYATSDGNAAFSGSWLGSNAWGMGGDFAGNDHKIFIGMVNSAGVRQSAAADLILTVDGQVVTGASTTTRASMNIPAGTAPTTPVTGDLWMTGGNLYFRGTSTTYNLCSAGGGITLSTALTGYTLGSNTALTASDTVLSGFGNLQAQVNAKEAGLGNPSVNGYVLASTTAGVRSWVAMGGGSTNNPTFTGVLTLQGTGTPPVLSNAKAFMYDTQNSYIQAVIQNLSSGANASSDLVLMTNTGSDSAEYIDLGINNSAYSGVWGAAKDGYLYVDGGTSGVGDLVIGTQQPNTYVDVNVGGGTNRCVRFAPDKSIILTAISNEPAVPSAGYLTVYAKSIAGRLMPKWVGPSGVDTPAQAALFQNRVILWTPGSGTAMLASGMTPTTAATLSHPTITTGSIGTVMTRVQFSTSTTAGNASGARGAAACLIGNASNRGGFFFACRFNQGSLHTTGVQKMVGLSSSTAALAGEPSSSMADFIGMCLDSTDSVWQFSRRTGTGAATKINLGVTAEANQVFELTMFAKPGVSELFVRILQIANDGTATTLLDTSYTTTIPAATTLLAPHFQVRNGALTAAHNMALGRLYLESDF